MIVLLSILGALLAIFIILTIIATIKKPDSVYRNKPEEQNPMEGKKVRFVENDDEKENADGVRGHLEAVGTVEHKPSFYERFFNQYLDITFHALTILSTKYTFYIFQ